MNVWITAQDAMGLHSMRYYGDIQFDAAKHEYMYMPTGKIMTPVTRVIEAIGVGMDYSKVHPKIVENARERGIRVDEYLQRYIQDGGVDIDIANERKDVVHRFEIACKVLDGMALDYIDVQPINYSIDDGIAGTIDFILDHSVAMDLKNTYAVSFTAWKMQLGAAIEYGNLSGAAAILHISPSVYKDCGYRLYAFDNGECRLMWQDCIRRYRELL